MPWQIAGMLGEKKGNIECRLTSKEEILDGKRPKVQYNGVGIDVFRWWECLIGAIASMKHTGCNIPWHVLTHILV
jgi:hypothetical protein